MKQWVVFCHRITNSQQILYDLVHANTEEEAKEQFNASQYRMVILGIFPEKDAFNAGLDTTLNQPDFSERALEVMKKLTKVLIKIEVVSPNSIKLLEDK